MSKKQQGFILIEAVVAFFFFAVLSSVFISMTQKKSDLISVTKFRTLALQAAESKLEELRSLPYEQILALHKNAFAIHGLKARTENLAGQIFVEEVHPGLLKIEIQTHWFLHYNSNPFHYSVITWIGKGGIFHEKS